MATAIGIPNVGSNNLSVLHLQPSNNVPTNPKIFNNTGTLVGDRIFTMVYPEGTTNENVEYFGGAVAAYTNLANTEGYKISCYEEQNTTGILVNPTDFDTRDYFVLVHSEDHLRHHFAKITQITKDDVLGDSFEFEPRLGEEIASGSSFRIFKGPLKTSSIIACSFGLKREVITQDTLFLSRPQFYFFNEKLDKKNELDHETKYFLRQSYSQTATITFNVATSRRAFLTTDSFGKALIDQSKFSMKVTLTDVLKNNDEDSSTSNEGFTYTEDRADYSLYLAHARRDADDRAKNGNSYIKDNNGPYRYLSYGFSPQKNNLLYNVINSSTSSAIGGRSGISETLIADSHKIISKKVKSHVRKEIRHRVFTAELDEMKELPLTITSHSVISNNFTLLIAGADDYFVAKDQIKINDNFYIIETISNTAIVLRSTDTSGNNLFVRPSGEGIYASAISPTFSSTDKIYRRAFSSTKGNLITDFKLVNNREKRMKLRFNGNAFLLLDADITAIDPIKKLVTVSFNKEGYDSNVIKYIDGSYSIEIVRFIGEIEEIDNYKENGQTFMSIRARDEFNKLLSPIINKNYALSEDIIYSSKSPYNRLTPISTGSLSVTWAFGNTSINLGVPAPDMTGGASNYIANMTGKRLFSGTTIVGTISGFSLDGSNNVIVNISPAESTGNSENLYVELTKNYIFSKALSSNYTASLKPTSLEGLAGKGIIFNSGFTIGANGSEVSSLPNTSQNTNPKAIGYDIFHPNSVGEDFSFQTQLKDEQENTLSNFDTINTLIDFEVCNISKKENVTSIQLAPYIPVTLGRKEQNHSIGTNNTFVEIGDIELTSNNGHTDLITSGILSIPYGNVIITKATSAFSLEPGTPLFTETNSGGKIFQGYLTATQNESLFSPSSFQTNPPSVDKENLLLFLDRKVTGLVAGGTNKLFTMTKTQHSLFFTNGSHLWGGKILSLIHPMSSTSGLHLLNYIKGAQNGNASVRDIANKYGQYLYKVNSLGIGSFNYVSRILQSTTFGVGNEEQARTINQYDTVSELNYMANAYKIKPNIAEKSIHNVDLINTNSEDKQIDLDSRGFNRPYGEYLTGRSKMLPSLSTDKSGNLYPKNFLFRSLAPITYAFRNVDYSYARLFLYVNSDINPYSSLRADSLMKQNRVLKDYNILFIDNKRVSEGTKLEQTYLSDGGQLLLEDKNFQKLTINSDLDISTLKRCGIMRLTELCFDSHYTIFNPEKDVIPVTRDYDAKGRLNGFSEFTQLMNSGNPITIDRVSSGLPNNSSPNRIQVSVNANLTTNDFIFDSNFNLLGKFVGNSGSYPIIDLEHPVAYTNGKDYPAHGTVLYKATLKSSSMEGWGGKDILQVNEPYHPQKYYAVNKSNLTPKNGSAPSDSNKFGFDGTGSIINAAWYEKFANGVNGQGMIPDVSDRHAMFMLPTHFNIGTNPNNWFGTVKYSPTLPIASHGEGTHLKHTVGVNLGGWTVGGATEGLSLAKGANSPAVLSSTTFDTKHNGSFNATSGPKEFDNVSLVSLYCKGVGTGTFDHSPIRPFASMTDSESLSGSRANIGRENTNGDVTGAHLGFKPRLHIPNGTTSFTIPSVNGNLFQYTLDPTNAGDWLRYIDLTGCYLVHEEATKTNNGESTINYAGIANYPDVLNSHVANRTINNSVSNLISYVVSHRVGTNTKEHHLIVDTQLTDVGTGPTTAQQGNYRIFQPNQVCFHDFSPNEIKLYEMSSRYTKVANENRCYDSIPDFIGTGEVFINDGVEAARTGIPNSEVPRIPSLGKNEAFLSMYVLVDTDRQHSGNQVVLRNPTQALEVLPENEYLMNISDGDTRYLSKFNVTSGQYNNAEVKFETIRKQKGVVSISETFTIESREELNIEPNRACIGSQVTITRESEDIINDLLENEDIEFESTDRTYPLYYSPDFKGVDLFAAINNILEKKDLSIKREDGKFKIFPDNDSQIFTNIVISDNISEDSVKILEYEKMTTIFEFYNEIIVYGSSHKSNRKDIKSVNDVGRKTLEIFEPLLTTQEQVDKRATELLLLHSRLNEKIKVKVNHTNLTLINAGDIISMEISKENIPMNQYIVLEILHEMQGFITLTLGKYSINLEDRLAELLISSKRNSSQIRNKSFNVQEESFNFIEDLDVKMSKLLIRTRENTGATNTLGFLGLTLNTNTTPFGFGSIVITDLLEEEF